MHKPLHRKQTKTQAMVWAVLASVHSICPRQCRIQLADVRFHIASNRVALCNTYKSQLVMSTSRNSRRKKRPEEALQISVIRLTWCQPRCLRPCLVEAQHAWWALFLWLNQLLIQATWLECKPQRPLGLQANHHCLIRSETWTLHKLCRLQTSFRSIVQTQKHFKMQRLLVHPAKLHKAKKVVGLQKAIEEKSTCAKRQWLSRPTREWAKGKSALNYPIY